MEVAVALLAGLVALIGTLLQLALIFEGLVALGRLIIPFLSKERSGWFGLWGAWHVVVFALLLNFAYDRLSSEMATFESVASQVEGLRILGMYLVLPLAVSFLIS